MSDSKKPVPRIEEPSVVPLRHVEDAGERYHGPHGRRVQMKKPTVSEIRAHHTPTVIPPCRVCGEELSLQACGGGEPTRWGCSGTGDDPERPGLSRYKVGRNCADEHYSQSVFVDRKHDDPGVLYLLDLVERMGDTLGRFSSEFPVPGCGYCTITIKPDGKVSHEDSCPIPEARGLLKELRNSDD